MITVLSGVCIKPCHLGSVVSRMIAAAAAATAASRRYHCNIRSCVDWDGFVAVQKQGFPGGGPVDQGYSHNVVCDIHWTLQQLAGMRAAFTDALLSGAQDS